MALLESSKDLFRILGLLKLISIAVSRALGDTSAKACGVTYEPDVSTTNIESDDFYLILGTDGVWDGISIDEAVNCLDLKLSPKELSKRILDAGLKGLSKNQIDDNITNVVVNLKAL